jgi:hypothetical protein
VSLKSGQIARLAILFELCGAAVDPCLAFGEQPMDNAGQVTRHPFDCFGGSESGVETSIARTGIAAVFREPDDCGPSRREFRASGSTRGQWAAATRRSLSYFTGH